MDVLFDHVAGPVPGKKSVTVCVRGPGPGRHRVGQTRTSEIIRSGAESHAGTLTCTQGEGSKKVTGAGVTQGGAVRNC